MRPDLPWNVAGIPPGAREAARSAAQREGLPVGEWLTRRILREFSGSPGGPSAMREPRGAQNDPTSGGASEHGDDADGPYRRVEDQLRALARGLEATERSQSDNQRAMSDTAAEINVAAHQQAQAFDRLGAAVASLTGRLERMERRAPANGMKDAVKALYQGLTTLADQVADSAGQSASQISLLANNIEEVTGKFARAQQDAQALSRTLEDRLARLDERLLAVEKTDSDSSPIPP